jgi:hypothetical protein
VRLISFGQPDSALAEALMAAGFELDVRMISIPAEERATTALASALREAESALQERPDAALIVGAGDTELAAALTAVKLDIPTAWVGDQGAETPLVARVAELPLDATSDAARSAVAIRELTESRITPA